jgi:predicted nucleic acid-binding protein
VILVDTSVWIDHLRGGNAALAALLDKGRVLGHACVLGELALGNLHQRALVLGAVADLPLALAATDAEVQDFIDRHALAGTGVGYIDAHLLASVRLTPTASLWTHDKRLHAVAGRLGLASGADA